MTLLNELGFGVMTVVSATVGDPNVSVNVTKSETGLIVKAVVVAVKEILT